MIRPAVEMGWGGSRNHDTAATETQRSDVVGLAFSRQHIVGGVSEVGRLGCSKCTTFCPIQYLNVSYTSPTLLNISIRYVVYR